MSSFHKFFSFRVSFIRWESSPMTKTDINVGREKKNKKPERKLFDRKANAHIRTYQKRHRFKTKNNKCTIAAQYSREREHDGVYMCIGEIKHMCTICRSKRTCTLYMLAADGLLCIWVLHVLEFQCAYFSSVQNRMLEFNNIKKNCCCRLFFHF